MKSYIQHLQEPEIGCNNSQEELGTKVDRRLLKQGKRNALVRSMSDPLLPVVVPNVQPIRRGRKRPSRRLQRNNSFDGELTCQSEHSCTNAPKPQRRSSIDNKAAATATAAATTTTLAGAIRQKYQNATRPTRRG